MSTDSIQSLTQELPKQCYVASMLKSSEQKIYGRHDELVDRYEIFLFQMAMNHVVLPALCSSSINYKTFTSLDCCVFVCFVFLVFDLCLVQDVCSVSGMSNIDIDYYILYNVFSSL